MQRMVSALVFSLLLTSSTHADNWPAWRGPTLNGVAPGKNFPTRWSSTENVAWKAALPGVGGSTPIVWGDRIFVTCPDNGLNATLCFTRKGQRLWQTTLGKESPGKHKKGSGSNPSPTTDGEHVFVYFKSGDFACLDFDGKVVWKKNLQEKYGEDTLWWDLGTSPMLTKNHVVIACMHCARDPDEWEKRGTDCPRGCNGCGAAACVGNRLPT